MAGMAASAIEWTDVTWNPTTGCDRMSPGCDNCYALTLAKRLKAMGQPKYQNDGDPRRSGPGFAVTLHEALIDAPRRWTGQRSVFVNSMSDLFHDEVPEGFIRLPKLVRSTSTSTVGDWRRYSTTASPTRSRSRTPVGRLCII